MSYNKGIISKYDVMLTYLEFILQLNILIGEFPVLLRKMSFEKSHFSMCKIPAEKGPPRTWLESSVKNILTYKDIRYRYKTKL